MKEVTGLRRGRGEVAGGGGEGFVVLGVVQRGRVGRQNHRPRTDTVVMACSLQPLVGSEEDF